MSLRPLCVAGQYPAWTWTLIWCTWRCKTRVEVRWHSICSFIIPIFIHETRSEQTCVHLKGSALSGGFALNKHAELSASFCRTHSHHWLITNYRPTRQKERTWSIKVFRAVTLYSPTVLLLIFLIFVIAWYQVHFTFSSSFILSWWNSLNVGIRLDSENPNTDFAK